MAEYLHGVAASGIKPIEIVYKPIYTFDRSLFGYRSILKINSAELGVLTPKQYDVVARRDGRCVKLANRAIPNVIADATYMALNYKLPKLVTIAIPKRMVTSRECYVSMLNALKDAKPEVVSAIGLEIPSEILFDDNLQTKRYLDEIKTLGVKLVLTEYGSEFCPTLKLAGLPFDYCVLDGSIAGALIKGDMLVAENVISFANKLKIGVIAEDLAGIDAIKLTGRLGAVGYCNLERPTTFDEISIVKED